MDQQKTNCRFELVLRWHETCWPPQTHIHTTYSIPFSLKIHLSNETMLQNFHPYIILKEKTGIPFDNVGCHRPWVPMHLSAPVSRWLGHRPYRQQAGGLNFPCFQLFWDVGIPPCTSLTYWISQQEDLGSHGFSYHPTLQSWQECPWRATTSPHFVGAQHKDGSLAGRSHTPCGRMDEVVRLLVQKNIVLIFCGILYEHCHLFPKQYW